MRHTAHSPISMQLGVDELRPAQPEEVTARRSIDLLAPPFSCNGRHGDGRGMHRGGPTPLPFFPPLMSMRGGSEAQGILWDEPR